MYWMTSSMFSLGQVLILRQPSLREKLGIPEAIHHPLPGFGNPFSKHSGTTASKTVSEFIGEIMLLVALSKSFLIM